MRQCENYQFKLKEDIRNFNEIIEQEDKKDEIIEKKEDMKEETKDIVEKIEEKKEEEKKRKNRGDWLAWIR